VFSRVIEIMCENAGCTAYSGALTGIRGNLCNPSFRYSVTGGVFVADRGVCRVISGGDIPMEYCYLIEKGKNEIPERSAVVYLTDEPLDKFYLNVYKISIQVNLGSAIINGRLHLRQKMDGDSVFYGGITHKLKKLYNDRKIPLGRRANIPLLCDDGGVVCVPGWGVRDDGVNNSGPYFTICINDDGNNPVGRFYSGGEFKS